MTKTVIYIDHIGNAFYYGSIHLITGKDISIDDLWASLNEVRTFYPTLFNINRDTHDLYVREE